MGKSIVVSATPERLEIAKKQMQGLARDAIFSLPFIKGLYLHYLPKTIEPISLPSDFCFELVLPAGGGCLLSTTEGFNNALIYDANHPYQTAWSWRRGRTEELSRWPELVTPAQKCGGSVSMCCPSTSVSGWRLTW
jgi:hypothetical protein